MWSALLGASFLIFGSNVGKTDKTGLSSAVPTDNVDPGKASALHPALYKPLLWLSCATFLPVLRAFHHLSFDQRVVGVMIVTLWSSIP
jgi:hypothetical protein